jgi:hypothetical protein
MENIETATQNRVLDPLLDEKQLAKILHVSVALIRRWRQVGGAEGPAWIRVGRQLVRYTPESVKDYIASRAAGGPNVA